MSTSLSDVQSWFQKYVVSEKRLHPSTETSARKLEKAIKANSRLESLERVDIYRNMYPLRMYDALSADYPILKEFLGEEEFRELVSAYIAVHPSMTYTLNRLGDQFTAFIAKKKSLPRHLFLVELAAFESDISQVFDATESERLTAENLKGLSPEKWMAARLERVKASCLHRFRFPVNLVYSQLNQEKPIPRFREKESFVFTIRQNYKVWRWDINRAQYEILLALEKGKTVTQAISKAIEHLPKKSAATKVGEYFQEWVQEGVFSKLR